MNFPKFLISVAALFLLACLAVGGFLFVRNGELTSQIAQVTPMPAPIRATMPFIEPVIVRATPEPDIQVADIDTIQPDSLSNIPTPHGIPTPLPASEEMARGEALDQMYEIDRTWEVAAPDSQALNSMLVEELSAEVVLLYLGEFFNNDFDPFTGTPPTMTDKLLSLDGRRVEIRGYMAPPLKLGLDWFLLGELPLGVCPFHANVQSITAGSALVYVEGPEYPFSNQALSVVGEMHIGELTDPETGMVSIARLYTEKDDINVLTLPRQ